MRPRCKTTCYRAYRRSQSVLLPLRRAQKRLSGVARRPAQRTGDQRLEPVRSSLVDGREPPAVVAAFYSSSASSSGYVDSSSYPSFVTRTCCSSLTPSRSPTAPTKLSMHTTMPSRRT